jgi:hypothetical protein
MEKTPLEELKELMPQIKKESIHLVDVWYIQDVLKTADDGNKMFSETGKKEFFQGAADYLGNVAESNSHYISYPEAQALLKNVVGLISRLE